MNKGLSKVMESGHSLLLGWSDKTIPTIIELANANESEGGGVIVVLAEMDKQAMEEEVRPRWWCSRWLSHETTGRGRWQNAVATCAAPRSSAVRGLQSASRCADRPPRPPSPHCRRVTAVGCHQDLRRVSAETARSIIMFADGAPSRPHEQKRSSPHTKFASKRRLSACDASRLRLRQGPRHRWGLSR
jgi:hypothetical protein